MATINTSNGIISASSLREIVAIINSTSGEFTKSKLAGQYAYDATMVTGVAGYDEFDAQLNILEKNGANFSWSDALDHALTLAGVSDDE